MVHLKQVLACSSAEAGGFEPPVRLPVRQFSKLVVSATHPHFQIRLLPKIRCKGKEYFRCDKFFFGKVQTSASSVCHKTAYAHPPFQQQYDQGHKQDGSELPGAHYSAENQGGR